MGFKHLYKSQACHILVYLFGYFTCELSENYVMYFYIARTLFLKEFNFLWTCPPMMDECSSGLTKVGTVGVITFKTAKPAKVLILI